MTENDGHGRRVAHVKQRVERFFATDTGLAVMLMLAGSLLFAVGATVGYLTGDSAIVNAVSDAFSLAGGLIVIATGPVWAHIIHELPKIKQALVVTTVLIADVVLASALYIHYPDSRNTLHMIGVLFASVAFLSVVVISLDFALSVYRGGKA